MRWIAALAMIVLGWLVTGWVLMLVVGIVHAEWIPQLPTIGFGLALLLAGVQAVGVILGQVLAAANKLILGSD